MIPPIIHFIWIGSAPVPPWARRNIELFRELNPGHQVRVHGQEVLAPELADSYARATDICQRSDILRYSVLAAEGGWYFDCDFRPVRPLADASRAFCLDGSRLLVAKIHHNVNPQLPWANAPLACGPAAAGILEALRLVPEMLDPASRVSVGPRLIARLVETRAELLTISDWPCWFPAGRQEAAELSRALDAGCSPRVLCSDASGGQVPFAMHLWAGGKTELPAPKATPLAYQTGDRTDRTDPTDHQPPTGHGLPATAHNGPGSQNPPLAAVCVNQGGLAAPDRPFRGFCQGLERAGYRVAAGDELSETNWVGRYGGIPAVIIAWNGRREPLRAALARLRDAGSIVLQAEHGFLGDRQVHTQLDHEGFLHWSSWRRELVHCRLNEPKSAIRNPQSQIANRQSQIAEPPPGAADRLAALKIPRGPMQTRRRGYVLVIGQTDADTQIGESPIQAAVVLERAVLKALPRGTDVYFRPHPLAGVGRREILPRMPVQSTRLDYRQTKTAHDLAEALAGARFVVTINSNAGNEALALGVPVVAFGPALYLYGGVARRACVETFAADLRAMLDGWCPTQVDCDRYLAWLAARQWTAEEFAQGDVLRGLLKAAGAEIRGQRSEVRSQKSEAGSAGAAASFLTSDLRPLTSGAGETP